jgi:hypothetical protein
MQRLHQRQLGAPSRQAAALTAPSLGAPPPANRIGADGRDMAAGDKVDVPGDMLNSSASSTRRRARLPACS